MTTLLWVSVVYIVVGIVYTVWCFNRAKNMKVLLSQKETWHMWLKMAMFNILMQMPVLVAVVIDIIRSKR